MPCRSLWNLKVRAATAGVAGLLALSAFPALAENSSPGEPMARLLDTLRQVVRASAALEPESGADEPVREASPGDPDAHPGTPQQAAPAGHPIPASSVRVTPQGRVQMHVRGADLASVLHMLSVQSQRNIIASRNVSGKVTASLYNVTFEEALTAILDGNNCGWRERGNFIYVYTADEMRQMDAAARQTETRLFRLRYTRAVDVQTMIQPLLSSDGRLAATPAPETGIAPSSTDAGGDALAGDDALLVIDYPDRLQAVERLIAELDVRPRQVLIEATILRAQLSEENALGIDFNLVGGVDFQNLSAVSPGILDLTVGTLPEDRLQSTTFAARTDFRNAVPGGGLSFGIIKNSVAAFIRALEQVTDTTVLANPKILTLNKQRGEVIVGRRDGYLTTTVTETAAIQSVEFLETGTQLRFRPFIGNDGYVRMEVHPEDSTGGLTSANLPFAQTTEVTTNILVRDGHTILIGGLFREVSTAGRSQVPLVGNVPVAGALFRNRRDNTQREEVIILLTVHIIKDHDAAHHAADDMMQDVERYRVGMRKGLQWFGRERLAQAHYQWALEHAAKGRTSRALWDIELALNNNPTFLAASRLKEQLLEKRAWEEDTSAVRGFILRQIMKDQGVTGTFWDRPGTGTERWEPPPLLGDNGFHESPESQR